MSFVKQLALGIEAFGVTVHQLKVVKSANPLTFVRQGLALRRRIRETRPAVVVAQFGTYTGLLVALFGRRPIVITYRGSDLNPEPHTNAFLLMAQHATSHIASFFADGIVCVSDELAMRLLVGTRRAIITSPTDLDMFRPLDREECRRALGWSAHVPTAAFFAGNNPKLKEIDLAREVQAELLRCDSLVTLVIVQHEVPITAMPTYLNAADCLLFLSRYEGSPNLVREACACNLPVVATPAGDIARVLRDVVPSRIVSRDTAAIAQALEDICRTGARSNGRERAMEYSTEIIARQSLDFYQEIADRHSTIRAPTDARR